MNVSFADNGDWDLKEAIMMPDREKVNKGLECCSTPGGNCAICPYEIVEGFAECTSALAKDALALLKEQETSNLYKCPNCGTWVSAENVVRCKDCKKRYTVLCIQEEAGNINNQDDWFCANGEHKET